LDVDPFRRSEIRKVERVSHSDQQKKSEEPFEASDEPQDLEAQELREAEINTELDSAVF